MFARNASMHLKPNALAEFTRTFEKEVVPVLRQQKAFRTRLRSRFPVAAM
jgi:hypothetical protein